jgi:hypothetical protein
MRYRSLALACLPAILITACAAPGPSASVAASSSASSSGGAPVACAGRPGSVVDVASEPNWREFGEYRTWTTAEGNCLIRIDVISDRPGPAHCGFDAARVIITGMPIGARFSSQADAAEYVRDPENVLGDPDTAAAFDPDADLPPGAVDTGFRQDDTALWFDPADQSVIYLVTDGSAERWPLDRTPTLCS